MRWLVRTSLQLKIMAILAYWRQICSALRLIRFWVLLLWLAIFGLFLHIYWPNVYNVGWRWTGDRFLWAGFALRKPEDMHPGDPRRKRQAARYAARRGFSAGPASVVKTLWLKFAAGWCWFFRGMIKGLDERTSVLWGSNLSWLLCRTPAKLLLDSRIQTNPKLQSGHNLKKGSYFFPSPSLRLSDFSIFEQRHFGWFFPSPTKQTTRIWTGCMPSKTCAGKILPWPMTWWWSDHPKFSRRFWQWKLGSFFWI